jgi:ApeA N-terminal domain 1
MNLLEERGVFWWNDEPIPKGDLAPSTCVAGQLIVEEKGRSRLELDGNLPHSVNNSLKPVGFDLMPEGTAIRGILKEKTQHVLLSALRRSGHRFSNIGMSYETFRAENCIVGDNPFPPGDTFSQLRSLEIDLTGFEAWLGLRSIDCIGKRSSITVNYKKPKDLVYPLNDGKLSIRYRINWPFKWQRKGHSLTLNELAILHYDFSAPRTLEDTKVQYHRLEEWLILMTNSEHSPSWPEITVKNKNFRYNFYFFRERNTTPPPGMLDCYPRFALVREHLGKLFAAWKENRDKYGSAFVLYVASRRGFRLYTENRFINFIWAMESYHRTKFAPAVTEPAAQPSNLDKKVQRILNQIARPKDRNWVEERLQHVEVGLKERITQVIMSLPLKLERGRCEQFGEECGQRRNDLSHYGGRRDNTSPYDDFHGDLYRKSDALFYLLHVLILQELGIDADILHQFVYSQGPRSFNIKHAFAAAGLLDESVSKPSVPTPQ